MTEMTDTGNNWQPAGAVTGVGALPQQDVDAAVRCVARACPVVPFWPQLPQHQQGERLLDQALAPLADLVEPNASAPWTYGLRPNVTLDALLAALYEREPMAGVGDAAGLDAFERAWQGGSFAQARAVKGQVLGPVTLGLHLYRGGQRARPFADHPMLMQAIGVYLARLARRQAARLAALHANALVFLAEPMLESLTVDSATLAEPAGINALSDVLQAVRDGGALAGVHVGRGDAAPWLEPLRPDVWAFDAHHDLAGFCASDAGLAFVQNGGRVAFGLVPTGAALNGFSAEAAFTRWLQAASVMGDVTAIARQSLITATGGLGRVDPPALSATMNFAHRVSYLVNWIASGQHAMQNSSG